MTLEGGGGGSSPFWLGTDDCWVEEVCFEFGMEETYNPASLIGISARR